MSDSEGNRGGSAYKRVTLKFTPGFTGGLHGLDESGIGAALFAITFIERVWFEGRVPVGDATVIGKLLFRVYVAANHGNLLSKKEIADLLEVEHMRTSKRYIDIAVGLGAIRIEKSSVDARVDLVVLTDAGVELVEKELEKIKADVEWGQRMIKEDIDAGLDMRPEVGEKGKATVDLGRLEDAELESLRDPGLPARACVKWLWELPLAKISEAVRLMPGNVAALKWRAYFLWIKGDFKAALEDLDAVIKRGAWDPGVGELRARICYQTGKFKDTNVEYARILKNTDDAVAKERVYWERAHLYLHVGKFKEALADLERVRTAVATEKRNEAVMRIKDAEGIQKEAQS